MPTSRRWCRWWRSLPPSRPRSATIWASAAGADSPAWHRFADPGSSARHGTDVDADRAAPAIPCCAWILGNPA